MCAIRQQSHLFRMPPDMQAKAVCANAVWGLINGTSRAIAGSSETILVEKIVETLQECGGEEGI